MAPRSYTLKRRAETATATRRRILEAATDLYRDRGIDGTTLTAVAERADVARGTVIHHFGSADGLLGAALDDLVDRLELPDERLLDGVEGWQARVRTFIDAIIAFQERSQSWWTTFESDMTRPVLKEREARYWAMFERLLESALGPDMAKDSLARAIVLSLSHPATAGTFGWAFERAGRTSEEARQVVGDLAIGALERIAEGREVRIG
jgi:AcrR family transcriptional regulator